ncbi:hypothetical protein KC929_00450 [Patescibacteria group bacterium]|nr:hypothetical protein [Patescibacteria group bacterium]
MGKLFFFFDCDEFLVDIEEAFKKFVFNRFGFQITESIQDIEKIENELGISREKAIFCWSEFNKSEHIREKEPNPFLYNFILNLSTSGYEEIHIVTSRPEDECGEATEYWKAKFFGDSIKTIQFCNTYSKNQKLKKRKKSEAIGELVTQDDFIVFGDDTHRHVIDVAETFPNNSLVCLLTKSWNKNRELPNHKNLSRVQNEEEFVLSIKMFMQCIQM